MKKIEAAKTEKEFVDAAFTETFPDFQWV